MQRDGALPRSRRYMAVPFVGKDTPTASSEFAHPDVAIGISILAYRYEGLRKPDFGALIQNLRHMLEAAGGALLAQEAEIAPGLACEVARTAIRHHPAAHVGGLAAGGGAAVAGRAPVA